VRLQFRRDWLPGWEPPTSSHYCGVNLRKRLLGEGITLSLIETREFRWKCRLYDETPNYLSIYNLDRIRIPTQPQPDDTAFVLSFHLLDSIHVIFIENFAILNSIEVFTEAQQFYKVPIE
jgi:hypothetical protein